jgi:4-amino-4-deoxy-L-arabinose transferase-like glycosyltransferase
MTAGVVAAWEWLERHPRRTLLYCLLFAALLRVPFLDTPLQSDEGGFLMVAGQWHGHGDALYTDQWVDRPPFLLLMFKLADALGAHPVVLRLMSLALGSVIIVAAWWAGRTINGARGAVAAAVVAASLSSSYILDGYALTGETIAGAFVMTSCALLLEATFGRRSPQTGIILAVIAGLLASLAFLTKQNFVDAGVFAAIVLAFKPHRTWRLMTAGLVGLAIPLFVTAAWASSNEGPGLSRLWVAMFRFRQRSLGVIEAESLASPIHRLKVLGLLVLASGVVFLVWQLIASARKADHSRRLRVALTVMLLYALLSILAGASWWSHYLLQPTAVLSMGAALSTRRAHAWLGGRAAPSFAAASSVAVVVVGLTAVSTGTVSGTVDRFVGDYLREASHPGDSVVLAYGSPNVIETSGLTTPYKYSWSLPIRTRDPHLKELVTVLTGPDAPTWLIEIGSFNWWGLDTVAFQHARRDHYHVVAQVCGHDVYLHEGLQRTLPTAPAC